jgi:methyltransferase-like protein
MGIDASWGQFDYILCHGVYSWVPEQVREKILGICQQALSPNGVVMVSYNVLPGWKFRSVIREMMLYHASQIDEPSEQISQARAVLGFMAENCPADTLHSRMLQEEVEFVAKSDDQYFYHEHLEKDNHAVYFHEFIECAEADGLQYLSDSKVASMLLSALPPKMRHASGNAPLVRQHQYMDFLDNRKFRSTLLCHQGVAVNWNIGPELLRNFQLSLAVRSEPFEARFDSKEPLTVRIGSSMFTINSPVAMAVFEHLSNHWPRTITIDELHTASIQRLAASSSCGESFDHVSVDEIIGAVSNVFAAGVLDFCVHPAPISNLVSSRPSTTPLARLQASTGNTVTNLRHENVKLDEFTRYLVRLLDSHHDLDVLSDKIQTSLANGELALPQNLQQLDPVDSGNLGNLVGKALTGLCNASLLTS